MVIMGQPVTLAHILTAISIIIGLIFGTFQLHTKPKQVRAWWKRNWVDVLVLIAVVAIFYGGWHGWWTWLRHPITLPLWVNILVGVVPLGLVIVVFILAENQSQRSANEKVDSILSLPPQIEMFKCVWRLSQNRKEYIGPPLCPTCYVAMKVWAVSTPGETWTCLTCEHSVQWHGSLYTKKEEEVTDIAMGDIRRKLKENNLPINI